jgi:HD-GYP domain-containing protein (c-di-GMP phosphodiesterase class II)
MVDASNITHSSARLTLLYRLSQVFNSSLHLRDVLEKVMDEVIRLVRAERGFLMLYDGNHELQFQAARGMDRSSINKPDFQVSHSILRRVAREGIPLLTNNAQAEEELGKQKSIILLGLRSVLCVPLMLKGEIIGVIYVDNRMQVGQFNAHDCDLLQSIAANASVAIENARLFEDLATAYDTTLEGWSMALELRDRDTQGHSRRVVDLSMTLGQAMGLDEQTLIHLKRGALLHDIGKMGIPDSVLLKSGPLTEDEWGVMHRHPEMAYQFLCNIPYLLPALDVPYCHHERWDGSGYPRGLKGTQIPLIARIFTVVDVWDAITSNRPYRTSLEKDSAIEHMASMAGKHFDPQVVEAFIRVVQAKA